MFIPANFEGIRAGYSKFIPFHGIGKVSKFVEGILGMRGKGIKKSVYSEGFPGFGTPRKADTTSFTTTLIQAQEVPNLDILPIPSARKIRLQSRNIPYGAEYYNLSGRHISKIPRDTYVTFDSEKTIYTRYNVVSKKYEAFLKTESMLSSGKGKTVANALPGFIRATWLDTTVSPQNETPNYSETKTSQSSESSQKLSQNLQKKQASFDDYLGIDGKPLPAYILRAVTVNYCNTILTPKVSRAIEGTVGKLNESRKRMVAECLENKTSIKETQEFREHQKFLEQKGKLEAFGYALKSFTGEQTSIVDPTYENVLASIQKTTDWQDIITKASLIARKVQTNNSLQRKTASGKHTLH